MARNNLIKSPADPIASPPKGFKGTGGGTYDGQHKGIVGKYSRTRSASGVPEKQMDSGPLGSLDKE